MRVQENNFKGILVLEIAGRIDFATSYHLDVFLSRAIDKNPLIILDLTETEYVSSLGLRVLLAGLKKLRTKKGDMKLVSLQPTVKEVFEISGLSKIFSIHYNLSDALDSLEPQTQ
ncbi:STAS domain protein [uncultured archaeon]|nr:STAS domain protein [uncultured archaeon]